MDVTWCPAKLPQLARKDQRTISPRPMLIAGDHQFLDIWDTEKRNSGMKLPLCLLLALCPFLPARQWTNQEGQTIEAEFQSLEDEQVSLLMNGKVISYPLAKLSPADQEFARNSQAEKEKARIVKTGSYARENISTRLFPSIEDYFKDRDREDIVKAFEAGKGWDEDRNGDRNSWLKRDEGTDHCSFYVPADFKLGEPGYGLLLVINPGDNATIPKSWHPVLDELKL
ncbi:MAG: SHD1 domain-containing protein, partial [Verrucomicrobiales bacterium]